MIDILSEGRVFHLQTRSTSYVFYANQAERLEHLYYGKRIHSPLELLQRGGRSEPASVCVRRREDAPDSGPDILPQEYAGFNTGDMREPAIIVRNANGAVWTDFRFVSARTVASKHELPGLPQSFGTEQNLEITLKDAFAGLELTLFYSVYEDCDVIARSALLRNFSDGTVFVERMMSAQVDLVGRQNYEFVNFIGSWSRERHLERTPLHHGIQATGSLRGSSGHNHTPAMILCEKGATETMGEAIGFVLAYSGNHYEGAEVDTFDGTRVQIGIHPDFFSWKLGTGDAFQAPEMFMTLSSEGLGAMSRNFHDFMRAHVIRSPWNGRRRPILINNWEATFFRFNTEKILAIAQAAAELNIEMLVLDDGWFGHRDNGNSSLGDWFEYTSKIGDMKDLADGIHALGMKFGLWFEPEMISEDSDLYRAHPDWVLCTPGRPRCYGRNQLILDCSREDVIQHIFNAMAKMIEKAGIDYVKWDMNRNMSEAFSTLLPADQQGELPHRYILGVYRLHELLLQRFPHLLVEGCSSGGGRYDAGMLYYTPQIWASDNTNAMDRLAIQAGTSMIYPVSSMGAHINVQRNEFRYIPFETRGNVAMAGTFGYELDLTKLNEEDKATAIRLNRDYHRYHDTISEGNYYRLSDVFSENPVEAWCCAAKDCSQAVLTVVRRSKVGYVKRIPLLKVPGLDPEARYRLVDDALPPEQQQVFSGDTLMHHGLWCSDLDFNDCTSKAYFFCRV